MCFPKLTERFINIEEGKHIILPLNNALICKKYTKCKI